MHSGRNYQDLHLIPYISGAVMISSLLPCYFGSIYRFFPNHSQNHFFTHTRHWRVLCIFKNGQKIGQKLAIFQPNFCPDSNLFEFNHNILWSNPTFSSLFLTQLVGFILHHYYTLNVGCENTMNVKPPIFRGSLVTGNISTAILPFCS